jgi:hypothetical protein
MEASDESDSHTFSSLERQHGGLGTIMWWRFSPAAEGGIQ